VLVATLGACRAIGLSVIPGMMAAVAIYADRHTTTPTRGERKPLRIRVRPVLIRPLRPLSADITAFEVGNFAATLLILRATELLEPGHGDDRATTIARTREALPLTKVNRAGRTKLRCRGSGPSSRQTPRR